MKLSAILGQVPDYLEYAWVVAPNAAAQNITANTLTTLTLNTEVADYGNHGSLAGNDVTLAAGTYYFEAVTDFSMYGNIPSGHISAKIFSLFNTTDNSYIIRQRRFEIFGGNVALYDEISSQFVLTAPKTLRLQMLCTVAGRVGYTPTTAFTSSTAIEDQRTTLKLWKLL